MWQKKPLVAFGTTLCYFIFSFTRNSENLVFEGSKMALLTSRYLDIISSGHSLKFFRKIVKIERVTLRVVILDESQIYFVWKGNPEARLLYTCETKMAAIPISGRSLQYYENVGTVCQSSSLYNCCCTVSGKPVSNLVNASWL